MLDFKNLNNQELVAIYDKIESSILQFDDFLAINKIAKIEKRDGELYLKITNVTDEQIDLFKKTNVYTSLQSAMDKLEPVVGLIKEEFPEYSHNNIK